MDRSEYYAILHRLIEENYGWQAIQDLTKMLCMEWNDAMAEAREARWHINTVRKFIDSEMSNKHKIEAITDVLSGVDLMIETEGGSFGEESE
jgi:hypothetical protein